MQVTPTPPHPDAAPAPPHSPGRRRLIGVFTLLLILVSVAVLPPLINVSRFQKRIARNISAALGRPVYFDNVTLMLFPQPGFTLTNFVIDEDPAFGYEPILRADQVQVTLRLSSLFGAHTEFSKIAFSAPSVNLVYTNGRWNIENLLLQAAHVQAAPTAQRFAGPDRRFPYIEATSARLNLKLDQEKSPISLTDTDFALWLPQPHQWRLRLEAHPMRTDTAPGDTGTLRVEGTLGAPDQTAGSLAVAYLQDIPIDLHGDWEDAQLGGLSRLVLGRDPGLRGDFAVDFTLRGTVDRNTISANLQLAHARRADFVPDHPLSLEASCTASATRTFRAFPSIECHWPPAGSSDPPLLALTAALPDARHIGSNSATLTLPSIPADTFFDWLSIATPHPPAVLPGTGTLTATLTWNTPPPPTAHLDGAEKDRNFTAANHLASEMAQGFSPGKTDSQAMPALAPAPRSPIDPDKAPSGPPAPNLTGEIRFTGGSLILDPAANRTLALGDVVLTSAPPASPLPHSRRRHRGAPAASVSAVGFTLQPLSLDLGGPELATLTGHFDAAGYILHLTGSALPATLRQIANAIPQLGDNLAPLLDRLAPLPAPLAAESPVPPSIAEPIPIDLTAARPWHALQTWTDTSPHR